MPELNVDLISKLNDLVSIGIADDVESLLELMINELWQKRFQDELGGLPPAAIAKLREMHEGIQRGEGHRFESIEEFEKHFDQFMKKRAAARAETALKA